MSRLSFQRKIMKLSPISNTMREICFLEEKGIEERGNEGPSFLRYAHFIAFCEVEVYYKE